MTGALSTDLYEITMAAGYHARGQLDRATFELWVRELPPERGYLVVAGLDQALTYLDRLCFSTDDIAYLRALPVFRTVGTAFFDDYLPRFRFRGDVWAVPEGTPMFAEEPLLRVSAALPEAQIVETALLSTILFQTMIASKASRVVEAAGGRPVVEFGGRRAHGTAAAALAARAAWVGGCSGTSNLEAGAEFDIPVSGTMAHSWVMSHRSEDEAFRRYVDQYGEHSVLVLDTYDTLDAARRVVAERLHPAAVRLDSGDLLQLSRAVRAVLDAGGHEDTRILASGDLDEYRIAELVDAGAPIAGFGVGTALSTSADAPSLSGVYKPVEVYRGGAAMLVAKSSPDKQTRPGVKQVWRTFRRDGGEATSDVVALRDETVADGVPLLECVMRDGRRVAASSDVGHLQRQCREAVGRLPRRVRGLRDPARYTVRVSAGLRAMSRQMPALAPDMS